MRSNSYQNRAVAFTLLEMMVVIAIIIVLGALITPATTNLLRSSRLEQAGLAVMSDLDLARQLATSRNRRVEMRFIRFASDGPSAGFRATQVFLIEDNGEEIPQSKLRTFPQGVAADPRPGVSSIFDSTKRTLRAPTEDHPTAKERISYFAMRFNPDGGTDLQPVLSSGGALWFLTLHNSYEANTFTGTDLPDNYWTIQIDPASGQIETYRP